MRVKTAWFKQAHQPRPASQTGSVLALTIWRLAEQAVAGLSRAGYDIVTPERGLRILAEMGAFLLHAADRMLYRRVPEAERAGLLQACGSRLAEIMEQNVHDLSGDDGFDYRASFIDLLNRRGTEYAAIAGDAAGFPLRRQLASCVRELMLEGDRHWITDQVMESEAPRALATLERAIDGFYPPPAATAPERQKASD